MPDAARAALDGWTKADVAFHLEIGMTPDGDLSGGQMAVVIEHGTAHLTARHLPSDTGRPRGDGRASSPRPERYMTTRTFTKPTANALRRS